VLATSEDGTILLAGESTGSVAVWDLARKKQLGALQDGSPWAVDFMAANSKTHFAIVNNTCQLTMWDLNTMSRVGYLPEQDVLDLKISENGEFAAILLKDSLHVRHRVNGPEVFGPPVSFPTKNVNTVSISPDSKFVALATEDGGAQILGLPLLTPVKTIDGNLGASKGSTALEFDWSGKLILRQYSRSLVSFEPPDWTGSQHCDTSLHITGNGRIPDRKVDPEGFRIVRDASAMIGIGTIGKCCSRLEAYYIAISDLNTCKLIKDSFRSEQPLPPKTAVSPSADGKVLYYADRAAVSLSSGDNQKETALESSATAVTGLTVLSGSQWLVDSTDSISLWSLSGSAIHRVVISSNDARLLAFGQHGAHYVSGKDSNGGFYVSAIATDLGFGEFALRGVTHIGNPFGTKFRITKQYLGAVGNPTNEKSCTFNEGESILAMQASQNRDYIVTISSRWPKDDQKYHEYRISTCESIASGRITDTNERSLAAVSNDGLTVAIASNDRASVVRKGHRTEIPIPVGSGAVSALDFSDDSSLLALGLHRGELLIVKSDGTSPQIVHPRGGTRAPLSVISLDDNKGNIFIGADDGGVRAEQITPGERNSQETFDHVGAITAITHTQDRKFVFTGGADGTTGLRLDSKSSSVKFVSFREGGWDVLYGDRFDCDSLENEHGASWISPEAPLEALPLEIFMRDYYEPRLLPRLLSGEEFPPIRALGDLNRVRPLVQVKSVERGVSPDVSKVTVEVSKNVGQFQRDGKAVKMQTEVYDLRLFREGQLVGQEPEPKAEVEESLKNGVALTPEQLQAWQDARKVRPVPGRVTLDAATGKLQRTFTVRLPHGMAGKDIEFTAYAFNEDRVKSETAKATYRVPTDAGSVHKRAYLVTMGVNAYENQSWDLHFAASDAKRIQEALGKRLTGYEVVPVSLISDCRTEGCPEDGDRRVGQDHATKAALHAVLEKLAGHELSEELKKSLPPEADGIRKAEPDDLVLIFVSSHGYTSREGTFYMVPSDSGDTEGHAIKSELLQQWISSDELSGWLRDVDAGDLVMIVDTCHSASTVEEPGFKPGPMGSRGLGQLAYDKGMRILAATQADDVALEVERLKQGLLTYALVQNGLEDRQAAVDGKITIDGWLQYGVDRVPDLYQEVLSGKVQKFTATSKDTNIDVELSGGASSLNKPSAFQQPSLFNFRKQESEIRIIELP
jgi:hypothetical protein